MVLKRESSELPDLPDREVKRQHFLATASGNSENGHAVQELVNKLVPLIRSVVRGEIGPFWRPLQNQIESSGLRTLQLRFDCELPATIFTGNRILSEDGKPVKIVLYDSGSKNIITSGSLSSLKVNIVVLDGDFSPHDQNNWTEREFESKIVSNREGRRPLLTGELIVYLEEGVCYIGDANFTDNSSWNRSGKFRLGVKMNANYNIREGVSGAFKVKDHRGELYQKNYSPLLDTEVWLLDGIAKDGAYHKRLAQSGIHTVGDFLRSYDTNPSSLRSLVNISNNKKWDAIIGQATTCNLDDDKLYSYTSANGIKVFFNCIYNLVGATFDGQNYLPLDKLNMFQMRDAENLKQHVYRNLTVLVPIDDKSAVDYPMLLPSIGADNFNYPSSSMQNANFPVQQGTNIGSRVHTRCRLAVKEEKLTL